MRHPFRSAAVAAGLVAVLAAPIAGVLPAAASNSSSATSAALPNLKSPRIEGQACKDDTGITVVVDFRDLTNAQGRRMNLVEIGCAEQPVGNGFDALLGAGFQVDPNQPFVCQIDDRPMNSADCSDVGYWAYAHGLRGHRWHYSNVGAGDWTPPAGSLEGWSWAPYGHSPGSWSYPRVSPRDLFPR